MAGDRPLTELTLPEINEVADQIYVKARLGGIDRFLAKASLPEDMIARALDAIRKKEDPYYSETGNFVDILGQLADKDLTGEPTLERFVQQLAALPMPRETNNL